MSDTQQWARVDFKCDQGSEWRRYLRFWQDAGKTQPMDFTDVAVDMHIREGVADSGAGTVAHLSSRTGSDETPRILFIGVTGSDEDPDPDGTPDPSNGYLMLLLSAEETQAIVPAKLPKPRAWPFETTFYYDMEFTPAGADPTRRMAGEFVLSLEVTRR